MHYTGDTISSRSYYAMTALKQLQTNTPIRLQSMGNEVIEENWDVDTTNLMVFAGKSLADDQLYLLISNLNSDHSSFNIDISNLPWTNSDDIRIIKNEITDTERFTQSETIISGHHTITITAEDYSSPSVLFYRIEKVSINQQDELEDNKLVFTNPVKDRLVFSKMPENCKIIEIYNMAGQEIKSSEFKNSVDVAALVPGYYLLVLNDAMGKKIESVKFQKI